MLLKKSISAFLLVLGVFSFGVLFIPQSAVAGVVPCGLAVDDPNLPGDQTHMCGLCDFVVGINNILLWGRNVMVAIGVAVIVAMGVWYILSNGNQTMITTAKSGMFAALIGITVILLAWTAINTVLRLKGNDGKPFLDPNLVPTSWDTFSCNDGGTAGAVVNSAAVVPVGKKTIDVKSLKLCFKGSNSAYVSRNAYFDPDIYLVPDTVKTFTCANTAGAQKFVSNNTDYRLSVPDSAVMKGEVTKTLMGTPYIRLKSTSTVGKVTIAVGYVGTGKSSTELIDQGYMDVEVVESVPGAVYNLYPCFPGLANNIATLTPGGSVTPDVYLAPKSMAFDCSKSTAVGVTKMSDSSLTWSTTASSIVKLENSGSREKLTAQNKSGSAAIISVQAAVSGGGVVHAMPFTIKVQ